MAFHHRPKLGQHFLCDSDFQRRLVAALGLYPDDLVIEIGAGRGELTELLAEQARHVIALEVDEQLASHLKQKCGDNPRVEVCVRDILQTDLGRVCREHGHQQCFVFGNLPYYITSPILHHVFRFRSAIRSMGLLMQREVAERVTALPGTRDYGYLRVMVQTHSQPRASLHIPPGAFRPRPQVHSTLVVFAMEPSFPLWSPAEEEQFLQFVKLCFAQKRKTILNNLAARYSQAKVLHAFEELGFARTCRAEQLPIDRLAQLYGELDRPNEQRSKGNGTNRP